jgi:hypothetical protein
VEQVNSGRPDNRQVAAHSECEKTVWKIIAVGYMIDLPQPRNLACE